MAVAYRGPQRFICVSVSESVSECVSESVTRPEILRMARSRDKQSLRVASLLAQTHDLFDFQIGAWESRP